MVYKLQLSNIPCISKKYADAIIKKYPTMIELITSLKDMDDEKRIELIKNIKYRVSETKKRKLGIKVATNLNKYLFNLK